MYTILVTVPDVAVVVPVRIHTMATIRLHGKNTFPPL